MLLSGTEYFVTAFIFHTYKKIWYSTSKYEVVGTTKSFIKFREHFSQFFTFKSKSLCTNMFRSAIYCSFIILYETLQ